ncbi:MAG: hypothetical protein ABIP48_04750 [Planctomycetota bacterium]
MTARQVTQIVTSLVVLALVGEPRFDFADCTFGSGGLLAAEALPESKSAGQDAKESREFRAAMAAHHICSGLWVVGRSHKRTPEEVVAQDIAPFKVFGWEPEFEYEVDHQRRMVTVTAPGAPPRTAKYNGDQGTTILPPGEKDVYYKPVPVPRGLPDAATQPWPTGDVGATEPIPDGVDAEAVAAALDWAMEQVPRDAYWSAGFMGQVTLVIPSRDVVVVRMGPSPGGCYPYLNEVVGRILETLPGKPSAND